MLETQLRNLIKKFLSDYVESEKLDIQFQLWKSENNLRLENVHLKQSILPSWIPFRFKVAHIGELNGTIPFTSLGTTPAKIILNDVLLILAPRLQNEQDEKEEMDNFQYEKRNVLDIDLLQRQHGTSSEVPVETEGYFGQNGYIGRLITRLIDNLQIEIRYVYV